MIKERRKFNFVVLGGLVLILVCMLFLGGCGFEQVDNGYRGYEVNLGKVNNTEGSLTPGLYFYNPFTSDVHEVDIRTQVYEEKLHTYTADVQQAVITVKLNYSIRPDTVHTLVQETSIGNGQLLTTIILPALQGDLKKVIGKYEAVELIAKRGKATEEVFATLKESLDKRHINVEGLELVNIDYTKEFEKSVEDKVIAVQRAVEAQNKTKQVREEATQQIITAQAQAESMRIRANALASNPKLVEYEAVQKWDGKLPMYSLGTNSLIQIPLNK